MDSWLTAAVADAERRGLLQLKPLLETLARSTAALRAADLEFRAATDDATLEGGAPRDPAGSGTTR